MATLSVAAGMMDLCESFMGMERDGKSVSG
jgi:hypothetical protein